MDLSLYEEMKQCLEKLTHSGSPSLSVDDMKKLKSICKVSDDYVQNCHTLLMQHLSKEHAEVRLSAVQVIDQLFRKSHTFREELTASFRQFLVLAIGIDSNKPLPPPVGVAKMLKEQSLLAVKEWYEKYGDSYPKLKLGYQYLNHNLSVNFDSLVAESEAQRRRVEEQEEKQRIMREQRLLTARNALKEKEKEIDSVLTQMNSCFTLLLPRLDQPDIYFSPGQSTTSASGTLPMEGDYGSDSDEESESEWVDVSDNENEEEEDLSSVSLRCGDDLQTHGIPSRAYSVTVELSRSGRVAVEETEDNSSILSTLRDCVRIIKQQFLPFVRKQIEVFTKLHGSETDIQTALDLRENLLASLQKYCELKIVDSSGHTVTEENVDEPGSSTLSGRKRKKINSLDNLSSSTTGWTPNKSFISSEVESADPTSIAAQLRAAGKEVKSKPLTSKTGPRSISEPHEVSSRKESLLVQAPVVPFDKDLMHWGEPSKPPEPAVMQLESLHRFWVPDREVILTPDDDNRIINFTGTFEPVTKACRFPLPSGKLCPRKDRYKCPLHGPIIPRDEQGAPVDRPAQQGHDDGQTSAPDLLSSTVKSELWKDVSEEVSRVLNVDVRTGEKEKGKGKKRTGRKKYPGLTDLKTLSNTSRKRLEKIVLNRKSLERVADSLDRLDAKKFDDKFGNNYNYSLRK